MSARRKLLTNLALAAGSVALTLILAELILTGVLRLEAVTLEHDALLGFRGRPGLETPWRREMAGGERIVRTNVQGYHDHERQAATPAHTRRIVFLGDSFVEAYQVEVDENFTQRLGQSLTQRGGELGFAVEAVNQGVHGYGLGVHYLTVRQRLADWHPDAVVLALFLGNDLQDNFAPLASASVPRFRLLQGRLEYTPVPPYGLKTWLRDRVLARSTLMRLFWLRVVKANRSTMQMAREAGLISTPNLDTRSADYLPEMLGVASELLAGIHQELVVAGVPLFVYVIPDPFRVHDLATPAADQDEPEQQLVRQRADLEGALVRTLLEAGIAHLYPRDRFVRMRVSGERVYRNGFGHFTQLGHQVTAELLEEPLWEMVAGVSAGGSD